MRLYASTSTLAMVAAFSFSHRRPMGFQFNIFKPDGWRASARLRGGRERVRKRERQTERERDRERCCDQGTRITMMRKMMRMIAKIHAPGTCITLHKRWH